MPTAAETIYNIADLSTGYRRGGSCLRLSSGVSAKLCRGELTCLIGANGAGKSTLLRTLAGLQPPVNGSVELLGKPLGDYSARELATRVSVVLTDEVQEQNLTAFELVATGRMPYTGYWGTMGNADRTRVDEALELVGMSAFADRRLSSLSDGERQKLMIAKALVQDTDVVLFDEPVAFLDFPSKIGMMRMLDSVARESGRAVLLSIHDIEIALQMARRLWVLHDGGFIEGEPHALAEQGRVDFLFAGSGITFDRQTLQYSLI